MQRLRLRAVAYWSLGGQLRGVRFGRLFLRGYRPANDVLPWGWG